MSLWQSAPLPRYNLVEPSEDSALGALERVLGPAPAREVWEQACSAVGIPQPRGPLTRRQLRRVVEHLARQEGFVGVMGTALRIRIDTYEALSASMGLNREEREPQAP